MNNNFQQNTTIGVREHFTRSKSKKCLTQASKDKNLGVFSKRTEGYVNPRIARRMKKIIEAPQITNDKCAICLSITEDESGKLQCGHEFCMPCLVKWWRHHPTCPCCREQIMYIINQGKIIYFCELPPEQVDENQPFIAHCQLCWGEIQPHEKMNICTVCRSIYWHSRCLPFKSKKWYCAECAGEEDQYGESN